MALKLFDYQLDAVKKMKNGCILCGGVGSGKSLTSLSYYYLQNKGSILSLKGHPFQKMKQPKDLYIITTARKRDTLEWEKEFAYFLMSSKKESSAYKNQKLVVDSWNNIGKYKEVKDSFFIFDEQRVIGRGVWVKSFLRICKRNKWILLSATPGDTWEDYIPVFLANGFYKNRTAFNNEHVIFSRFTKYPKIDRYLNTKKLEALRNEILVDMDYNNKIEAKHEDIFVDYDKETYKELGKKRWDPYKNEPIVNAASLCYLWRKVVNSDKSREFAILETLLEHPKAIIFYNFDYELEIIRNLLDEVKIPYSEWNGHKHETIPEGPAWAYLVQYTAGSEGWNCTKTDTIIFYSQNYSYKVMVQAAGRIDRLDTPYKTLYYYHIKSKSAIDLAIARALRSKKKFNEKKFVNW